MYYSNEIIDEVRSANDIVDVVSSYVKIQKKGANYMGLCPFHAENLLHFQYHRASNYSIVSVVVSGEM